MYIQLKRSNSRYHQLTTPLLRLMMLVEGPAVRSHRRSLEDEGVRPLLAALWLRRLRPAHVLRLYVLLQKALQLELERALVTLKTLLILVTWVSLQGCHIGKLNFTLGTGKLPRLR